MLRSQRQRDKVPVLEPSLGIDLGTTYSCVAAFTEDRIEIIENAEGQRTTPSMVAFGADGTHFVGYPAKCQMHRNAPNTIYDAKRILGVSFSDESLITDLQNMWPFKVIPDDANKPLFELTDKRRFSAEEISTILLKYLKNRAEARLSKSVTKAVITVPASFGQCQRAATRRAAVQAGFEVLRVISEPVAAALAYGHEISLQGSRNLLVFDWGGGTLDVSVVNFNRGVFRVRAAVGEAHLGGEDFDSRIADFYIKEVARKGLQKDVRNNPRLLRSLKTVCEQSKIDLSSLLETCLEVPVISEDIIPTLSRARFDAMCSDLYDRALTCVKSTLRAAKMQEHDINEVLLVGGTTRLPKVRSILEEFFPNKPLSSGVNPDEAVAYGAALQAAALSGAHAHSNNMMLKMLGQVREVTLLPLGVSLGEGEMCEVIKRHTPFPVRRQLKCETRFKNQLEVTFKVFQGASEIADFNVYLGQLSIVIPPGPEGTPLDVALEVNEDGLISVEAKLRASVIWKKKELGEVDLSDLEVLQNLKNSEEERFINAERKKKLKEKELLYARWRAVYEKVEKGRADKIEQKFVDLDPDNDDFQRETEGIAAEVTLFEQDESGTGGASSGAGGDSSGTCGASSGAGGDTSGTRGTSSGADGDTSGAGGESSGTRTERERPVRTRRPTRKAAVLVTNIMQKKRKT